MNYVIFEYFISYCKIPFIIFRADLLKGDGIRTRVLFPLSFLMELVELILVCIVDEVVTNEAVGLAVVGVVVVIIGVAVVVE